MFLASGLFFITSSAERSEVDLAYAVAATPPEKWTDIIAQFFSDSTTLQNIMLAMATQSHEFSLEKTLSRAHQEPSLCKRIQAGCPLGWTERDHLGTTICRPYKEYEGPCLDGIEKSAAPAKSLYCKAPLPCQDTLCLDGSIPLYEKICPEGWIVNSIQHSTYCQSNSSSSAPCKGVYDFGAMTYVQRELFSLLCDERYSCNPAACAKDYTQPCPDKWYLFADYSCAAQIDKSKDACLQTSSGFANSTMAIKAAFERQCPNAVFQCIRPMTACTPNLSSCPTGFVLTDDSRACTRLTHHQDKSCPDTINYIVMDENIIRSFAYRCNWTFPCLEDLSTQIEAHPRNRIRKRKDLFQKELQVTSIVFE